MTVKLITQQLHCCAAPVVELFDYQAKQLSWKTLESGRGTAHGCSVVYWLFLLLLLAESFEDTAER